MDTCIYSKVTAEEKALLDQVAFDMDRTISWVIRDALIAKGHLPTGR